MRKLLAPISTLFLVTFVCLVFPNSSVAGSLSNGVLCNENSDCTTNVCKPGADSTRKFCAAPTLTCARENFDGMNEGDRIRSAGVLLRCTSTHGWIEEKITSGLECWADSDCSSLMCQAGAGTTRQFCKERGFACARQWQRGNKGGTPVGVNGQRYVCVGSTGEWRNENNLTRNGLFCSHDNECASSYCRPAAGSNNKACLAKRKHCALFGSDGTDKGRYATVAGIKYKCLSGARWNRMRGTTKRTYTASIQVKCKNPNYTGFTYLRSEATGDTCSKAKASAKRVSERACKTHGTNYYTVSTKHVNNKNCNW